MRTERMKFVTPNNVSVRAGEENMISVIIKS